jgi:hypothetical protein
MRPGSADTFSVVNSTAAMARELEAVQRASFPTLVEEEIITAAHYEAHVRRFPEGQLAVTGDGRVVACSTDFQTTFRFDQIEHRYIDAVDHNRLGHHDPQGDWLYGADIGVLPAYRRRGIARLLYGTRRDLIRRLNLRGHIAGGLLRGYGQVKARLSVEDYVAQVIAGTLFDPTLSVQLRCGFRVHGIIQTYVHDPACDNKAALIVWHNPDFHDVKPGPGHPGHPSLEDPGRSNLQRLHHLGRPAPGIHLRVPLLDGAVLGDHYADALRALVGAGVGAVGRTDRAIRVTDEREVEVVLVGERLVLGGRIEGDAEDDGSLLVVVRLEVAEPATLRRSPRCVGLRKEPQHDGFPREVRQPHGLAVMIATHEVGCLASWPEHVASGVRGGGNGCSPYRATVTDLPDHLVLDATRKTGTAAATFSNSPSAASLLTRMWGRTPGARCR